MQGTNQDTAHVRIPEDPLLIVQSRYAKGEITKKEFDALLRDLSDSNPREKSFCSACGSENAPDAKFCIGCGVTIS